MRLHNIIATQKNVKSLLLLHLFVNIIHIIRIRTISRLILCRDAAFSPPLDSTATGANANDPFTHPRKKFST